MPKVSVYINEDYYPKWKRVKQKAQLIYLALDAIPESTEMPNGTVLIRKATK